MKKRNTTQLFNTTLTLLYYGEIFDITQTFRIKEITNVFAVIVRNRKQYKLSIENLRITDGEIYIELYEPSIMYDLIYNILKLKKRN